MATRRRYSPPKYRDGGAVPISADPVALVPAPLAEIEQEAAPARPDEPQPPPPDDALRRAIEGQRRAEELQRQTVEQQRPLTIDDHIEAMPISDFKKATLRAYPELLDPSAREVAGEAYQEALAAGIADDTPAMTSFMLSAVRAELQERRQRLATAARSAAAGMIQSPPPDLMLNPEQGAERLMLEADALMNAYNAERSSPLAVADQVAAVSPPPAPTRRSMPLPAPVSRDVPMPSGRRFSSEQMTLTAEERHIARHSFTDPGLSNTEKERMYLMNKIKLGQERAAGRYPMPERN